MSILGISGALLWDAIDLGRIRAAVREDYARKSSDSISAVPTVAPLAGGMTLGLVGRF